MADKQDWHAGVPLHILEIPPGVSIGPPDLSRRLLDRPKFIDRLKERDAMLPDDELAIRLKPGLRPHLNAHRSFSLCLDIHIVFLASGAHRVKRNRCPAFPQDESACSLPVNEAIILTATEKSA